MAALPQNSTRISAAPSDRRLQVLIVGHELRVESLEILLSQQQDLRVMTALVEEAFSTVDTVLSFIERRRLSRPIDVVLIDWDGEGSMNMALLNALAKARQRTLVVTSLMLPSDLEALQKAGAWGYVLTTASSRHLYTAIGHVAQGRKSFPPVQASLHNLRVKRQLVFYPERLKAYANDVSEVELTPIALQILAHLAEPNAVKIASRIDRQQGTIRTELSMRVFPFLRQLAKKYQLPIANVTNQKEAFEVAQMVGIFCYQ